MARARALSERLIERSPLREPALQTDPEGWVCPGDYRGNEAPRELGTHAPPPVRARHIPAVRRGRVGSTAAGSFVRCRRFGTGHATLPTGPGNDRDLGGDHRHVPRNANATTNDNNPIAEVDLRAPTPSRTARRHSPVSPEKTASDMSASVTIDWQAVRERERQACLGLRAELAQLRRREKQLRVRHEAVRAAHGRHLVEIRSVGRARGDADSAELQRIVGEARAELARAAEALDCAIGETTRERVARAAAAPTWTARVTGAAASAPRAAPSIDLESLAGSDRGTRTERPAPVDAVVLVAEADAVLDECRLRCPRADLGELARLRADLGSGSTADRAVVQDIRYRAARLIQQVKREDALEEQRERLFVLADAGPPQERAALRRRVADAPGSHLSLLEREVTEAVDRASALRARAEAVSALETSLQEMGYPIADGFQSLLLRPDGNEPNVTAPYLVVPSRHSADHGLRVRVAEDQLYVSVVRRAGSGSAPSGTAWAGAPAGVDRREASDPQAAADAAVQEQTCRDLDAAVASAAGRGVQLILGNAQAPGRRAPEMAAANWTRHGDASQDITGGSTTDRAEDVAAHDRRRHWAEQEHQRAAAQQAQQKRPGS